MVPMATKLGRMVANLKWVLPIMLLQSWTKYLRQTIVFMRYCALWESSISILPKVFAKWTKFPFREEDWVPGYISMKFNNRALFYLS